MQNWTLLNIFFVPHCTRNPKTNSQLRFCVTPCITYMAYIKRGVRDTIHVCAWRSWRKAWGNNMRSWRGRSLSRKAVWRGPRERVSCFRYYVTSRILPQCSAGWLSYVQIWVHLKLCCKKWRGGYLFSHPSSERFRYLLRDFRGNWGETCKFYKT